MRRLLLSVLRTHDAQHDTSLVRELEMEVDAAINIRGHIIQFWRDVQMYGVDEAILYLENGKQATPTAITSMKKMAAAIRAQVFPATGVK